MMQLEGRVGMLSLREIEVAEKVELAGNAGVGHGKENEGQRADRIVVNLASRTNHKNVPGGARSEKTALDAAPSLIFLVGNRLDGLSGGLVDHDELLAFHADEGAWRNALA